MPQNTQDLNKCSYILEAISLAYALKVFATYLLNCKSNVKIFTDAKSLIYAKRMSNHSILLNNTVNYISNFVSLINAQFYHLPGTVNVLADVLSRAIADNLNCNLTRDHPISKQWAKILPPIPENFSVNHETLFKFLTKSLTPETQDIYDRTQRKLMEPKTLQSVFDLTKNYTPEEKYNNAISLLEKWNSEYNKENGRKNISQAHVFSAKLQINLEKQHICLQKVNEILNKLYPEIKNTPIYNKLQKQLIDVSEKYLKIKQQPLTFENVEEVNVAGNKLLDILSMISSLNIENTFKQEMKTNFINICEIKNQSIQNSDHPRVYYKLARESKIQPTESIFSNGLNLPIQEDLILQPYQSKLVTLGIQIFIPKQHTALIKENSAASNQFNISITSDLLKVGFVDNIKALIQNMKIGRAHV